MGLLFGSLRLQNEKRYYSIVAKTFFINKINNKRLYIIKEILLERYKVVEISDEDFNCIFIESDDMITFQDMYDIIAIMDKLADDDNTRIFHFAYVKQLLIQREKYIKQAIKNIHRL